MAEEDPPRRFDVELFIIHPVNDSADITEALGLDVHRAQRAGDQRKPPRERLCPVNVMTPDGGTASDMK